MHRLALFALLAGCGSGVTFAEPKARPAVVDVDGAGDAPAPAAALPGSPVLVDGATAHPSSPASLDPELRGLVEDFEATIAAEPRLPQKGSAAQLNAWTKKTFRPYLDAQRERLMALEERGKPLMERPNPADRMLVAILVGRSWERLVELLEKIPAPTSIEADPDLLRVYRGALETAAVPLAHRAGNAYAVCATQDATPSTQAWHQRCEERAELLRAREAPPPAPPPKPDGNSGKKGVEGIGVGGFVACTSDADCRPSSRCATIEGAVDRDGKPMRICRAKP